LPPITSAVKQITPPARILPRSCWLGHGSPVCTRTRVPGRLETANFQGDLALAVSRAVQLLGPRLAGILTRNTLLLEVAHAPSCKTARPGARPLVRRGLGPSGRCAGRDENRFKLRLLTKRSKCRRPNTAATSQRRRNRACASANSPNVEDRPMRFRRRILLLWAASGRHARRRRRPWDDTPGAHMHAYPPWICGSLS